jgi:hypothetical protein
MRSLLLFLALTTVAASAAGQDTKYRAPRTEDGKPDLQGVWNYSSAVPLQRPAAFAGKTVITKAEADAYRAKMQKALVGLTNLAPVEAIGLDWFDNNPRAEDLRTSLISYPENGRLPALGEGVKRMPGVDDIIALLGDATPTKTTAPPTQLLAIFAAFTGGKKDSYTDFMPSERCLFGENVPYVPEIDGNYVQIIQSRDTVALVTDFHRRIVTLDVPPKVGAAQRRWSGTSTGHWEGETLVVDTRNFNDRSPSFAGAGTSGTKVVTERFTRTANDRIAYSATVVDPKTFKDRVELSFPMTSVDARIYEAACHEGNYSMRNSLSAARLDDEAKKAK